ncbi:S4 domain-containing protein [Hymenobacter weizhouensis]|uniref:S4 domain-containing protein n=1 Tax=Hymenobacter sp. YIM 151500-1 TaxID=2987689 RepID=UPI002227F69E|nr:S4 domain-containing protein [Hymenobacter sp. YIM 151500-1]UYZ64698.1 S4 domain-containing protein [Hymenobacter sp. YIM 151500-1]
MPTRLNKFISDSGLCSRREADRYIEQGQVTVNGKRAAVGAQVTDKDRVLVNGNLIEPQAQAEAVYLAYNKPPGVVTTTAAGVRNSILGAIHFHGRLLPLGRLDKDAQGLVLLSTDGEFVNRVLRSGRLENEYIVMVDKPISEPLLAGVAAGGGQPGAAAQQIRAQKETPYIFRITLLHDSVRQIERWCEQYGYKVVQMERIRVLNVELKGLGLGEWRELKPRELQALLETAGPASSPAPRRRKPASTAAPDAEQPAPAATGKARRPAASRPEDAWLELPTEPRKPRKSSQARPSGQRRAGAPGAGPAGPRSAATRKGPASGKPRRTGTTRPAAASPKGKATGRSRGKK